MATKYTGAGKVLATDYHSIKYVGLTKAEKTVTITMPKAICRSNPDWTFAEKDDVVAELQFEGVYDDDMLAQGDRTEPWTIELEDGIAEGPGEIVSRVGKFYVDDNLVGLTRGGGSFVVEREYREIAADDDPGAVEGRITQDSGRPKLTMNVLQFLVNMQDLYAGMKTVQ